MISYHSEDTLTRTACIALLFLLLLSVIPAYATNDSLPSGASVDLSFSPSRIPLGYSSTFNIVLGAEGTGTDLYFYVTVNFQDWLRWKTSDIRMGNFLYGGVVFKSDNQNLNSNFLQIAVVVPKDNYVTVQVPVTPTRTGIFTLDEIFVVTLPVVNGNFVLTPDGWSYQGLTLSTLQFTNRLVVYDPLTQQILDGQEKSLSSQRELSAQLSNVTSDISLITSLVNIGFSGLNDRYNQLSALYEQQTNELLIQMQFLTRAVWLLVGAIVVLGVCLGIITYRLSKART